MESTILTTYGLSETAVNKALAGFARRFPQIRIEVKEVFPEIHVRLDPRGSAGQGSGDEIRAAVNWSRQQLGERLLSADGQSLEEVVGDLLHRLQASIAVAESCTGGLISHLLTNVSGSSDYFLMAGITYSNEAKHRLLGVSEETLQSVGAVHENTAAEMALGVRRISGATYGLATTGIAGPTGGSVEKPVGTLCVGLADPEGVACRRYSFSMPDRLSNKKMFAAAALNLLRKRLLTRITQQDPGCDLCDGKRGQTAT